MTRSGSQAVMMASSPASPSTATATASHGPEVRYPDSRNDQVTRNAPASVRRARPAQALPSASASAASGALG